MLYDRDIYPTRPVLSRSNPDSQAKVSQNSQIVQQNRSGFYPGERRYAATMWPSRIWMTRPHAAAASGLCVIIMIV